MNNVVPIITQDTFDFQAYMVETEPQVKVLSPVTWKDALVQSTQGTGVLTGARLPWAKTHDTIRFRPGEVSLWQGTNGHGKSLMLNQVSLCLAAQDEPVCIASFEMKPVTTLKRMLRQVARTDQPSAVAAERMISWMNGRVWFYDQMGTVRPEMIYAVIRYCSDKLKIKHMVIDSLMKCVRGEDDYNGQKDFVDALTTLARDHGIHTHLVHHVRKSENEDRPPGKYDSKGTGAIADQVDNIFTVWRNKPKERAVEKEVRTNNQVSEETAGKPDAMLICDKQRNGEWEGRVPLWFHKDAMQYTPDKRRIALDMIGDLV